MAFLESLWARPLLFSPSTHTASSQTLHRLLSHDRLSTYRSLTVLAGGGGSLMHQPENSQNTSRGVPPSHPSQPSIDIVPFLHFILACEADLEVTILLRSVWLGCSVLLTGMRCIWQVAMSDTVGDQSRSATRDGGGINAFRRLKWRGTRTALVALPTSFLCSPRTRRISSEFRHSPPYLPRQVGNYLLYLAKMGNKQRGGVCGRIVDFQSSKGYRITGPTVT